MKTIAPATEHEMEYPEENDLEDPYLCVGICQIDADSGYCLGCGRPPLPIEDTVSLSGAGADTETPKEPTATT